MKTVADLMMEIRDGFSIEMLNEEGCRDWILKKIHPRGVFCPGCGEEVTSGKKLQTFWDMRRVNCPHCKRSFSAVTGTPLNGIGIEWRALYLLLFLVGHGVQANSISRQLGISNGAAYLWANKAKGKPSPGDKTRSGN
jgi:transposase-like protein